MEELTQEAENTGVETEGQDVSDSPSDEQELTREEQLERENATLKQHLREQSKKSRSSIEDEDGDEEESSNDLAATVAALQEQIEQLSEGRTKKASQYRETAIDKMYDTAWGKKYAPETPGSEREFAKLQKAFKTLSSMSTIESQDDYMDVLRKADVIVSGRPDALMDVDAARDKERSANMSKSMASGPGGTDSRATGNKLSAEENALLDKFGVSEEARLKL